MTSVSSVSSVSFNGSQGGNDNQSHTLRNTVVSAGGGALALGGYEFLSQREVIKHPDNVIKKLQESFTNNQKMLDSDSFKSSLQKFCDKNNKNFNEELARLKDNLSENFGKAKQSIKEFSKEGKYDWKSIGKTAAWGAAIAGGIYLAGHMIYSLFSNKNKK